MTGGSELPTARGHSLAGGGGQRQSSVRSGRVWVHRRIVYLCGSGE